MVWNRSLSFIYTAHSASSTVVGQPASSHRWVVGNTALVAIIWPVRVALLVDMGLSSLTASMMALLVQSAASIWPTSANTAQQQRVESLP